MAVNLGQEPMATPGGPNVKRAISNLTGLFNTLERVWNSVDMPMSEKKWHVEVVRSSLNQQVSGAQAFSASVLSDPEVAKLIEKIRARLASEIPQAELPSAQKKPAGLGLAIAAGVVALALMVGG